MSSGQSLRNGSSVEPGLPNTFLMPHARSRPKVASLTVMVLPLLGGGFARRHRREKKKGGSHCVCCYVAVNARRQGGKAIRLLIDGIVV